MSDKKDSIGKRFVRFLERITMPNYVGARDAAEHLMRMNADDAYRSASEAARRRTQASRLSDPFSSVRVVTDPETPRAYWASRPFESLKDVKKAHEEFAQAVAATEAFKATERAVTEAPPELTDRPARTFNVHVICSNEHVAIELARLILAKSIPDLYAGDFPIEGRKVRDWRDKLRSALWCHTKPMQLRYRPYRVKCQQAEGGYVPVEAIELDVNTLEPKP